MSRIYPQPDDDRLLCLRCLRGVHLRTDTVHPQHDQDASGDHPVILVRRSQLGAEAQRLADGTR